MRTEGHASTHGLAVGQRSASASPGEAAIRQILYHPARPTRDGRTILALSPLEFLAALERLIPPPPVHRHRYHGVLAPKGRLRDRGIYLGRDDAEAPGGTGQPRRRRASRCRHCQRRRRHRPARLTAPCRRPLPLG